MGVCVAVTGHIWLRLNTAVRLEDQEFAHTCSRRTECVVWGTRLLWETDSDRQPAWRAFTAALRENSTRMRMKQTLCRSSLLVTLLVELCWITTGHSMHRKGSEVCINLGFRSLWDHCFYGNKAFLCFFRYSFFWVPLKFYALQLQSVKQLACCCLIRMSNVSDVFLFFSLQIESFNFI